MVRQILLAGFAAFLPVGVQAQERGAMAPVSHAAAVAPRVAMAAPHAGVSQMVGVPRTVARGGMVRPRTAMPIVRTPRRPVTTGRRFDRFGREDIGRRPGCNSAPGLGFDAVHQAAVCGSGIVGSRGRGVIPAFFPFFDGGFFLPGSQAAVEETSRADDAAAEESDIEARETSRRHRVSDAVANPAPASTNEAASVTSSDNDEFVFVRRDGTIFFAVAYSWENGTLRYVTSQGLRHTVTQDALDLDATRQFNEQRGLNFRLPA
ncbi:MAG: hypothetical protein DMG48_12980 [Acidobacteria bacterium]|nr:MAG: hypothetical protein DMG48_12980 [Acidobacteriota bacterium]